MENKIDFDKKIDRLTKKIRKSILEQEAMKYLKRLLVILLLILFFCFMITTILFFWIGAILVSIVRYVIKGDFLDALDSVEDSYMFVLDKICSIGD